MTHSDDNGLVIPPKVAPKQVVIIPFLMKEQEEVIAYSKALAEELEAKGVRVHLDLSDKRSGEKVWHWIKKGVPARIEVGAKEIAEGSLALSMRHEEKGCVKKISREELVETLPSLLDQMQEELYQKALDLRNKRTKTAHTIEEFAALAKEETFPLSVIKAPWKGSLQDEERVKKEFNLSIRCILNEKGGLCPFSNQGDAPYALFAKSY